MHIFLLNGPAGSGKDTLGNHLAEKFNGRVMKFASPIKKAVTAIYFDGDEELFKKFDSPVNKEQASDRFFGKSCRDVQISISEDYVKPQHGKQAFGKILARAILDDDPQPNDLYFITDSGFKEEAEVLIEEFGAKNVSLIQIYRDNHSFDGDSRNYVDLSNHKVYPFLVYNPEGDLENFFGDADMTINLILEDR